MNESKSTTLLLRELKRLEDENAELKSSLQAAHDLIQLTPAFFGYVSLEGEILDLNELALLAMEAKTEAKKDDHLLGFTVWKAPCWTNLPHSSQRIQKAIEDAILGISAQFDTEYNTIQKGVPSTRWVAITITPCRDRGGEIVKVGMSGIDITERVAVQQQLAAAVSIAKVGFYDWDMLKNQVIYSEQMKADWGFESSTPIEDAVQRLHPNDRERTVQLIRESIQTRKPFSTQYRICPFPDKIVWIEAQGVVLYNTEGVPVRFFGTTVNIDQQRRANEQALIEKENLLSFVEQAPVAMCVLEGPLHIYSIVNQMYLPLIGHRTVIGKDIRTALPELAGQGFYEILDQVYTTGAPFSGKEVLVTLIQENGQKNRVYLNFTYQPWKATNGVIRGVLVVASDVSEEVRNREVLEASESRYREANEQLNLALDSAAMGTWHIDLKTFIATALHGTAAIFGVHFLKESIFSIIDRLMHPEDRERMTQVWQNSVAKRIPYSDKYRIIRPDGVVRWIFSRGTTKIGPDGEPSYLSGVLGDITDLKKAEDSLAFEKHKLEAVFQSAPAAMALWKGENFEFEKANPVFCETFGNRPLLGKPLLEACPELAGHPFAELALRVLKTGEPYVGKEILAKISRSSDGVVEDRYYDFSYLRINDTEGRPYGVYDHSIDVTDRILNRHALESSKTELQQMVSNLESERELRDRFVAALSHDLRTPLASAKMSAQLLARKLTDDSFLQKTSRRIVDSMDRADKMIRDLLDASRVKAGEKLLLNVDRCNLTATVSSVIQDLTLIHGARFLLQAPTEIYGQWDCEAIHRIVENLASNAVKYGTPKAPINITLNQDQEFSEILVKNQGNPISPDEQNFLFKQYKRAQSAELGGQRGWGIGLTLVEALTQAHQGVVQVKSSFAEGTTFTIRLPNQIGATL